jgi:hypothetical protein
MKPVKWKISESGFVEGPAFHDGNFYGVVIEDRDLLLYLRNYEGTGFVLRAFEVKTMNITNFWEGNIISHLSVYDVESVQSCMWRRLFQERINDDSKIAGEASKFQGEKVLFLESAYGASAVVVCSHINIFYS